MKNSKEQKEDSATVRCHYYAMVEQDDITAASKLQVRVEQDERCVRRVRREVG
jgi:hypothetical protein